MMKTPDVIFCRHSNTGPRTLKEGPWLVLRWTSLVAQQQGVQTATRRKKKITRLRNHNQPTTWKGIRQNILRRIKSSWKLKIWANTRQTTVIFRLYFKVISRQWKYTRTYQVIYIYIYISSTFDTYLKCLSHSLGGLHICNLWILLRENVIYLVGKKF